MSVRHALAVGFLAACTHHANPGTEGTDSAAIADTDGAVANVASSIPDASVAARDAEAVIDLPSDGGLAALLSGAIPAGRLAVVATDPGGELDRGLRARLTTVEVPDPDPLAPPGPNRVVLVGAVSATHPIADADRTVAQMRPHFRSCYSRGLFLDSAMAGKLVITADVRPNGEIGTASVASNVGLSPEVAGCVVREIRDAQFEPPTGGTGATVTFPISFAVEKSGSR